MKKVLTLIFLLPMLAMAQPASMKTTRLKPSHMLKMRMLSIIESLNLSDEKAGKMYIIMRKYMRKMEQWKKELMNIRKEINRVLAEKDQNKKLENLIKEIENLLQERQKIHNSFLQEIKKILSVEELAKFYTMFPPLHHSGGRPFQKSTRK